MGRTRNHARLVLWDLLGINANASTAMLDRVASTRNRINVIIGATERLIADEPFRNECVAALKAARKLLDNRNELVHGKWASTRTTYGTR